MSVISVICSGKVQVFQFQWIVVNFSQSSGQLRSYCALFNFWNFFSPQQHFSISLWSEFWKNTEISPQNVSAVSCWISSDVFKLERSFRFLKDSLLQISRDTTIAQGWQTVQWLHRQSSRPQKSFNFKISLLSFIFAFRQWLWKYNCKTSKIEENKCN